MTNFFRKKSLFITILFVSTFWEYFAINYCSMKSEKQCFEEKISQNREVRDCTVIAIIELDQN